MDIKQLSSPACSPQYTVTIPKETRVRLPVPGAAVVDDTAKVIGTNAQDLTLLCLDWFTGRWHQVNELRAPGPIVGLIVWAFSGLPAGVAAAIAVLRCGHRDHHHHDWVLERGGDEFRIGDMKFAY
jgi:hypothetical protein